jgi:hypothetical protein
MLFSTNRTSTNPIHAGDIVGDVLDLTKLGIVVGPGDQGIQVCWTNLDNPVLVGDRLLDVDPFQLVLVTKAAQC